jgi:HlyD family secretion protein
MAAVDVVHSGGWPRGTITVRRDATDGTDAVQRCGGLIVLTRGFFALMKSSTFRMLLTLALIAIAACKGKGNNTAAYKTEAASRGAVTMTVTATGTISAVTTVQVGSQVSGVIARLYVDFNSRVKKGQLLAELDPTPFQQTVEQRQADLTKARVDASNLKLTLNRQQRLVAAGLTSQSDLDAARAAFDGAAAQVQQATAAMKQAQTNLQYTKITSPIDGIVADRQYDVGQTVAASFSAPTLFTIAQDLTKMQVQADVDQSDIGRIQVGQVARFTVDAYPEEEFRGRIKELRLNATVTQNVVSYPVMVDVANPDERLRPKMTANVTIDVAQVRDVLRIPNAALRFRPESAAGAPPAAAAERTTPGGPLAASIPTGRGGGGRRGGGGGAGGGFGGAAAGMPRPPAQKKAQTVYVLGADSKLTPVQVKTGITDGHYTQVLSGDLHEGDKVVVGMQTSKVESAPPPGAGGRRGF